MRGRQELFLTLSILIARVHPEVKMTEKDVKDLLFTQVRKVQVGPPVDCSSRRVSLLVVSNKYGLTVVGCNDGLRVFKTAVLNDIASKDEFKKTTAPESALKATFVRLPSSPLILSLSSNETILSVCLSDCVSPKAAFTVLIYNIVQLAQGKTSPLCSFEPQKTTTDHVAVVGAQWNPSTVPSLLALCLSSGDVLLVDVVDSSARVTRSSPIGATSLCWSPKGKQLAVGLKNGRVAQLGQDLSKKKEFGCPDIFRDEEQVANLFWISTREFAVMYSPLDAPSASSGLPPITTCVILLTHANGSTGFNPVNFDDVHCGTGFNVYNFLFNFIPNWKLLMIGSSSAIEVAVLSQTNNEWEKWNLEGTARPEVPLCAKTNDDCYVAGMALDFTSTAPVQLSDELSLPPCPLLLIYSTEGIIMPYTIVNTSCSPDKINELSIHPEPLPAPPQTTSPTQPLTRGLAMSPTATSVAPMSTQPRPVPPQTALAMSKPATQGLLSSLHPTNPASVSTSGSTAPSPFAGGSLGFSVSSFLTKPSVGAASQPASAVQASITAGKPGIASSTTNAQSPLSLLPKVTPQPASSLAPALLKSPSAEGGGLSLSTIQKPQDSIATAANLPPQMSPITILPLSSTPLTQQPSLQQAQRTSQQQVQQQQQQVQQQQQQVQLQMMQRQQQQHMQQQQVQQQMMQRQQQQQQVQQQMIQQQQQQQVHQQQQVQLQMMQRQQQMQQQQQIQQQHIQRQQQIQQQQSGAHSVSAVSKPPLTTNSPTTIPTKPPPLTTTTSSAAPVTQQQARPTAAAAAPLPSHVQEKFDASFTNLIEQEIEKFVIDMNELTEDAVDKLNLPQDAEEERMRIIPQLGSMEDAMGTLVKGLDDLKETAMQIIDQTKELEGRVGAVGDKVLKGFELSEGSRIRLQKTTDTKHLMLLRLQPLDPHNTRRLNDIRNHFTQLEQKLREVNCQLDAELEFRHESIRQFGRSPMKPPPLQTVYSTLRNHRQITRVQRKSIEQLTDQMKSLQLLPRLWQPEHSCDLPAQSPPRSVSFTTPGYRSMMEPPSPEETERQREKNKKLKEQLLRIQRPTEILVPQGPPMMTYSLLPAASSFSPSLASSPGPGSSILPPPPPPPSSLSQQQSLPQTSTILSSLTQPLPPPPVSSLLTRVSGTASQPPSLSSIRPQLQPLSTSQPTSSLTQPPSLIARPPGSQPLSQSIVWPPGPQPLSQIVRPPGPQPLSQIVRLPGSQPLSQIVRPPGPQTLSQPIVRPPGSQTLSHRPPGSQPLSQPIVWLPGSQPLSQPIFRPPASQPSLSSFPQPPPPTAQPLTASKPPVPPVGILPTSRPSAASPLGISLTTAPHKDHTAAILTSTELHIPQGDQSLIFNLSKGNIGNSAVSPSSVSSSLSLGPSRTFSLATSLPPTSSIVPSAPSPPTTPSTSPSSSSPPSSGPPPPSDLFSLQGQRVPPSFASAAKPPPSPWPSYTSLQNTPPLQNLPRPPYSPMLSVAGSVGKNDTSEPPLPTTASEVLPSSSSSPHSASPNVVITKSDISLSQRLAISQSFSSGQSLPASLTMMPQTMPKPSVGLTQSTTSTMTTTTSLSLFSGLLGSSASASGPSFVFGSNPNTGGPKQPFTFASPSSVVSSQLLPNADSKKDGSSSAALSLGDGKNPVTTTPSVSFPIPVSTVQVPTTVTSTVTPTTASQTGMMTPPQDQPKNGNDLKNKTDHKESTPTSSDLPKLTDSLSTALNGGGKTSQINNPSSSLMQDEKPLPTSSVAVISQQAPSVTKTTESDTVTSSTVNVAKTLHSLTTQQSTGSDEEMENESDEHDVPGTGAQGVFGLGKGGLGGLGLGGPNPMTGTSTANPFGSIGPVTPASLPTGSSTSSLFQAPRGPLMSSSLRMPPPSSGTGLGLLGASGFGVSPVFGSGSPMFGSGPGLSQQRPPQVSMANTSQRLLFSGSNEGGAAAAGPTGLFTNQQSGPSFSALASSNGAGSTGFGQLAAGNTQLAAGSTQPFTMSGSQFQSYR